MFEPLFDALASVMNFFYTLVPNFGVAIMGLTVLVMVLITPLTVKSTRSMLEMQRFQPEIKRIQEKYKNDRERMNQEIMSFYQEHKINPLGGCLPLLAQMPVFFIMYRLMNGLTVRNGGLGTGVGHIAGQTAIGETLTPWILTDQTFRPEHLDSTTEMYKALADSTKMPFLGIDLSISAAQALKIGIVAAIPFFILLLVMLFTGIVQNRQLQSRNTGTAVNPQQQAIMKFMPFFLPVISFGFPGGLALYWCTQNVCRIGTNHYITRTVYSKEKAKGPIEARATEKDPTTSKGSKGGKGDAPGAGGTKASSAKGSDGNGSSPSGKGRAGVGGSAKSAKGSQSKDQVGPGKSIRSQKAHEKSAGTRKSTPSGSSAGGRRSGEPRRRSGEPRRGTNKE
jgi:YidC/Oxa1 family membrane protein insertase